MICFATECLKRPSPCEGRLRLPEAHLAVHCAHRGVHGWQLSEGVKASQPSVDWKGLAGFRNVLVHDYLGVDLELVYRAVEQDVPQLKRACEAAVPALEPPE